jgi:hypothetical protein
MATTTNERDKLTVIDNAKWRDCATANGHYEIQRTTYDSVGRVTMTETIAEADSATVQAQTLLINSAHLLAEHYRQQAITQRVFLEFTPQCAARIAVWYSAFVTEPILIIELNIKLS